MSEKCMDCQGRWRSKTVGFRMSPEENELLNRFVQLSGMTKQNYITARLLQREIVVQGNPRVYKALKNQLADVLEQLRRIDAGTGLNADLSDTIAMIAAIMSGMKEE